MNKVIHNKVYSSGEINFSISDLDKREEPSKVLMCTPEAFDVVDVKNVHMHGMAGLIDRNRAKKQWADIRQIYLKLINENKLLEYIELAGEENCEDMVFAANQSFPWMSRNGEKLVIMSKMRHASRQREVPFFSKLYESLGYQILNLQRTDLFEGMGDAIPHPNRYLIYGGYGHRTDIRAYEEISDILNVPVIPLELVNDKFYHLDTCFLPVDEETVLLFQGAFSHSGLTAIKKMFRNVIDVPEKEAAENFALNAHIFSYKERKSAIIHEGSPYTTAKLKEKGFGVFEVNTSEFMKSGGSVFCMKMMIY